MKKTLGLYLLIKVAKSNPSSQSASKAIDNKSHTITHRKHTSTHIHTFKNHSNNTVELGTNILVSDGLQTARAEATALFLCGKHNYLSKICRGAYSTGLVGEHLTTHHFPFGTAEVVIRAVLGGYSPPL